MKKEMIQKVLKEMEEEYKGVYDTIKENRSKFPKIGNFNVYEIEDRSRYSQTEEPKYRIELKDNDKLVNFCLSEHKHTDRLSWSSHSYHSMKEEEVSKACADSKKYLNIVLEMIEVIENKDNYKEQISEVIKYHETNMIPLNKKLRELDKGISELRDEIRQIEKTERLEKAKEVIKEGAEFWFCNPYYFSARQSTNYIKIGVNKKGELIGYNTPSMDYKKFKITDEVLLELFNHINHTIYIYDLIYDNNTKTYYKYNNLLTEEAYRDRSKIEKIIITEDEYRKR